MCFKNIKFKTTSSDYGLIRKKLHWLSALLMLSLIPVGLYMTGMPASDQKWSLYGLHKSFGVIALALIILRVVWVIIDGKISKAGLTKPERIISSSIHGVLYLVLLAMPISGIVMSMTAGYPISFFGLFTIPEFLPVNKQISESASCAHTIIGYASIALISVHVIASLYHHFIKKDDVLKRMTFRSKK